MNANRLGADYSIGQSIQGRWRIREIAGGQGKSGMGVVYIADDLHDDRVVAIKTFQPELVADATIRKLLVSEANVWLEMGRHENIVSAERVEVIGSQPLIFVEYIAPDAYGRNSLTGHLGSGALPDDTMLAWALGICAALAHMRACGIDVHRDLKPDNIMIDNGGTAKVTDFGLARAFDGWPVGHVAGGRAAGFAAVTGFVGTPGYIAPEVVIGHRASVRSDIYSFGLLLAQMITGRQRPPLITESSSRAISLEQFEQANLDIRRRTAPPTTRSPLHGVVSRCLQFDPANRYPHFPAVAEAIRLTCTQRGLQVNEAPRTSVRHDSRLDQAIGRVDSLRKLGRYDEALAYVQDLRRDTVLSPALLDAEGLVRANMGDLERAIELHEAACELEPDDAGFRNNLGLAYRQAKQFEAAHGQIAKALDLGGQSAGTWSNLAICDLDLKRYNEALVEFDRALALDPHLVFALLGRAEALYHLGRATEALTPLVRALEMEPDHPGAQELYERCQAAIR